MTWVVIPAAGRGSRMGGDVPKQYLPLLGRSLLEHTLERLAAHPRISGMMVALAADDVWWPQWDTLRGKLVRTVIGGAERADSVLAGIDALPNSVADTDWVLVHDAARPCLRPDDLDTLLTRGSTHAVGAILAVPVSDTLKRADADGAIASTQAREGLWRALTPQLFRRRALRDALADAARAGVAITDEAMAMERIGQAALLVQGAVDNIKVTTPADLAMAEFLLTRDHA